MYAIILRVEDDPTQWGLADTGDDAADLAEHFDPDTLDGAPYDRASVVKVAPSRPSDTVEVWWGVGPHAGRIKRVRNLNEGDVIRAERGESTLQGKVRGELDDWRQTVHGIEVPIQDHSPRKIERISFAGEGPTVLVTEGAA